MTDNIQENSLYDQTTKADILKDHKKVADIFWVNTLGFMTIYKNFSKTGKFKAYMKGIDKTRIEMIDDTSHDVASALKLAHEAKLLTPMFTMEFTKLLYILKTKTDIALDENALRAIFNKLSLDRIRPDARIAGEIKEWLEGTKTLDQIIFPLFYVAKYGKHSEDFQTYVKYFYKDFARRAIELSQQARGIQGTFKPKFIQTYSQPAGVVTLGVTAPVVTPPPAPVVIQKTPHQIAQDKINNTDFRKLFEKPTPGYQYGKDDFQRMQILIELFIHYRTAEKVSAYIFSVFKKSEFKKFEDMWEWFSRATSRNGPLTLSEPLITNIIPDKNSISPDVYSELYKFANDMTYKKNVNLNIQREFIRVFEYDILNKITKFYQVDAELRIGRYEAMRLYRSGASMYDIDTTILLRLNANDFVGIFREKFLNDPKSERFATMALTSELSHGLFSFSENQLYHDDFLRDCIKKFPGIEKTNVTIFKRVVKIPFEEVLMTAIDTARYYDCKAYFTDYKEMPTNPDLDLAVLNRFVKANRVLVQDDLNYFKTPMMSRIIIARGVKDIDIPLMKQLSFDMLSDDVFKVIAPSVPDKLLNGTTAEFDRYIKFFPVDASKLNVYRISSSNIDKFAEYGIKNVVNITKDFINRCLIVGSGTYKFLTKENYLYIESLGYNMITLGHVESNLTDEARELFDQSLLNYVKTGPLDRTLYDIASKLNYDAVKIALERLDVSTDELKTKNGALRNTFIKSIDKKITAKLVAENVIDVGTYVTISSSYSYPADMKNFVEYPEAYMKIMKEYKGQGKTRNYYSTYKNYFEELGVIDFMNALIADTTRSERQKESIFNEVMEIAKYDNKLNKDRREYFISNIIGAAALGEALNGISKNSPIPILKQVSDTDVKNILKFNNFSVKLPSEAVYRSNNRKGLTPYQHIKANKHVKIELPALQVSKIDYTEEDLEKMAIEYTKYYNNKHGDTAILFMEAFDVNLTSSEFDEFIKENPTPIVVPAFHGTGSIAASMILRFGFKIVTKNVGGVTTTGKMLGNGVYFSNIVSKAIQYLGDDGYTRSAGTIGYLFEMDAYIGRQGVHHNVAGTGGDSIRSPEWCVFDPRAQLKIKKAYKVKMVRRAAIETLKTKHPTAINEDKYFGKMRFTQFLKEEKENEVENTITFVFFDGGVPSANGDVIEFDELNLSDKMSVSFSQMGPEITFRGTTETKTIMVPNTSEMINDDPDGIYTLWKSLTDK